MDLLIPEYPLWMNGADSDRHGSGASLTRHDVTESTVGCEVKILLYVLIDQHVG